MHSLGPRRSWETRHHQPRLLRDSPASLPSSSSAASYSEILSSLNLPLGAVSPAPPMSTSSTLAARAIRPPDPRPLLCPATSGQNQPASRFVNSVQAWPARPARAVRPTRWS